ncbi:MULTISPECIES: hybrid sensor histidine kinase/response regulator [unclassified Polaromonas]|uniref:hybrid sensor histidine kinase/response regulator n=1 Tax=unclassified Polaromonas TaxID=2638319 RepID=UPI0018C8F3FA|nr:MULTISPECIES: hybrid sensor histidine kinase/response regulator [unclassified Polaromonas]MBG6070923.1 two-component system CheB/CheR fusion protein [Polaromonas sp. CG_9.7]MBG6112767.1 two-component system CheB/CheR fusion protein [Polaromonas sp. CG_9.2]MDH6186242.1 two-component system CheB/CheR fusion protein [Polaromonas sp. CG_23.6]
MLREANEHLVIASLRAQDLQDQAEASVERQTEFLSMLAHELRNPLGPIALAAEMLGKISTAHPLLPDIQQIIARQIAHMKRLLEDLLDAARVNSGKITLEKGLLVLSGILQSAAEISQPHFLKLGQQLIVDLPGEPVTLDGDGVRLSQVFSNLLINASKFSPRQASITVSARLSEAGTVRICVKDQGIGIDPKVQPFIFDLFTQASNTLDRSQGGLGIGLSMVRTLVQMHGGTVQVRSQGVGCGSEFIVELPVSAQAMASEAHLTIDAHPARPCRILVIEDNLDANATLNSCLTLYGHAVDSAYNGLDGLAMAKDGLYDIVVSDIGLPTMNGYEVIRRIRALQLVPKPFCVAITGYDQQGYLVHAKEVGFDHYLIKPVSMEMLEALISKNFPSDAIT